MAVNAELGVVRKVRTELEEEGAEVAVQGIDVVVIDHGRRTHNPGIVLAALLVVPLLGAKDRRFLLRLADEGHAFSLAELSPVAGSDIVLALPFLKCNQRNSFRFSKRLDASDKLPRDLSHQT